MSLTSVIELESAEARSSFTTKRIEPVSPARSLQDKTPLPETLSQRPSCENGSSRQGVPQSKPDEEDASDSPPPTTTAAPVLQRWNHPRPNIARVLSAFWTFVVMGSNDAVYGALIHYIERYYSLSYVVVSIIFLSPLVGYTASALMNNTVHVKLGRRGVAAGCSACHLLAYVVISLHPPYPVLVVVYMIAGFGNGLADAGYNAFFGSLGCANEMLGFLHAFYGLGAVLAPFVATTMVTKAGLQWYTFYYVMIGMAGLETVISVSSFWSATGAEYRTSLSQDSEPESKGTLLESLVRKPSARVTWLASLFLLGYTGIEVSLGGWIVVFMINLRGGGAYESGMTATGFWLGIVLGRVVLGFVTPRIGEWLAIAIYCAAVIGFQLLFWLVPQFIVSAAAVGLQGFFLGPLFPSAIMAMSNLLPRHLHVSAIGFAAAFGGCGSALLPFAIGAVAQAKGVQVLQPIILAFQAVILLIWLGMPRFGKKRKG